MLEPALHIGSRHFLFVHCNQFITMDKNTLKGKLSLIQIYIKFTLSILQTTKTILYSLIENKKMNIKQIGFFHRDM